MFVWLADIPLDFYKVHGTEYVLPDTWVNGNPPLPTTPMAVAALVSGLLLLTAALLLQRALPWSAMRPGRRALVLGLVVFNFFFLWETSLQVCARLYAEPSFVPDPVTFWRLNPQISEAWTRQGGNGQGWWQRGARPLPDQDSLREKSPGTYRIMFFGESQLVSIDRVEIDIPHSYPRVLTRLLHQARPSMRIEAINCGVPGFSSWQGFMLARRLLTWKPDLVVFAFGYHDGTPSYATDCDVLSDDPRLHAVRGVLYRSELFLLLRKWAVLAHESAEERRQRQHGGLPTFRVPVPDFERILRALCALGRENGFQVAFMFEPQGPGSGRLSSPPTMYAYQSAMQRVASEENALILDVFTPMQQRTTGLSPYWNDDVHMSAKGHEAVAEILRDLLLRSGMTGLSAAPSPSH